MDACAECAYGAAHLRAVDGERARQHGQYMSVGRQRRRGVALQPCHGLVGDFHFGRQANVGDGVYGTYRTSAEGYPQSGDVPRGYGGVVLKAAQHFVGAGGHLLHVLHAAVAHTVYGRHFVSRHERCAVAVAACNGALHLAAAYFEYGDVSCIHEFRFLYG